MAQPLSSTNRTNYNRLLIGVAGLGGLLYGVDVGIIGGALPYLAASSRFTGSQLSVVVAAVLLGSIFSTLFAGWLADAFGRKPIMWTSGLVFVASIPVIALSHSFLALFLGRIMQGLSGGFIGVVVPLYLAECLPAEHRGKGTAFFQWLLTLGIFFAALIGMYYSYRVEHIARLASAATLLQAKDQAWRHIFWMSMPPGILFLIGASFVTESPRWLVKKGRSAAAFSALLHSREDMRAQTELLEMEAMSRRTKPGDNTHSTHQPPLFSRRYVVPLVIACAILFCSTATGINTIIGYNTDILLQSGLSDLGAHWGYAIFTLLNFLMTVVAVKLVDRRGRRFLMILGTGGMIFSLASTGLLFSSAERYRTEVTEQLQKSVSNGQDLSTCVTLKEAQRWFPTTQHSAFTLVVLYSYGDFDATTPTIPLEDTTCVPIQITRETSIPNNRGEAFIRNPAASLSAARRAPLRIKHAYLAPKPSQLHGILVACSLYAFIAFFAIGPGVCVWLALSELLPTRIRSVGMSVALVVNQLVSTVLAGSFLPVVGRFGYSAMFFVFTAFTIAYFTIVLYFLPETKGKSLEEIEVLFEG